MKRAALLLSLLLVGCGKGSPTEPSAVATPAPTPIVTAPAIVSGIVGTDTGATLPGATITFYYNLPAPNPTVLTASLTGSFQVTLTPNVVCFVTVSSPGYGPLNTYITPLPGADPRNYFIFRLTKVTP